MFPGQMCPSRLTCGPLNERMRSLPAAPFTLVALSTFSPDWELRCGKYEVGNGPDTAECSSEPHGHHAQNSQFSLCVTYKILANFVSGVWSALQLQVSPMWTDFPYPQVGWIEITMSVPCFALYLYGMMNASGKCIQNQKMPISSLQTWISRTLAAFPCLRSIPTIRTQLI